MKLILVRHGETEWNKNSKLLSHTDIPLNKDGIKQAKKTASILKNKKFDYILSSPMQRALETAKEINKFHRLKIETSELLKERDYGDFEEINYFKLDLREIRDKNLYHKYNMENPEEFENRIKKFLECECLKTHGKTILLVSHSGTIKMILYHLLKIKESFEIFRKQINKTNASISTIEFDKNFNVINFDIGNDEHLI